MAKIARSMFLCLSCVLLGLGACTSLWASQLGTPLSGLARGIRDGVEAYARDHNGTPPKSWDDLRTYIDFERVENAFKTPVQSKMLLLGDARPTLEGADPERIIAMTAFAINDDRWEQIGRYVVVLRGDGTFTSRWANESAILKACAAVNLTLLPTAVFQERPQRVRSLEYAQRLVEDAVKHGVPAEDAEKVVKRHILEVKQRRAPYATMWAEIAEVNLPKEPPISVSLPQPASTEPMHDSSVWLWVGSSFALVAALGILWNRFRVTQAR